MAQLSSRWAALCIKEEGQYCNRAKPFLSFFIFCSAFTNQDVFLQYEFLNTLKQKTLGHDLK